ncbi:Pur regulon 18 kDa protein [Legionella massiliensis]|uniref:Pur regulon 18 kDa protein n=1 Tax=Legionella massiliensis TaxID=1034943 RepID=A0A078KW54_9GAMM|nr:CvpA family protein [Legionella massiliensis]CDZ77237.1 Pur regulon 18 kDa protein [Legionella massiliensis]CEE12975.1 Colicin V production protein [Legionella massiliensis]
MNTVMNWIDLGFFIIFLLSFIFGLVRGFIRSIVSLFFLIVAVYLGIKYAPQLAEYFAKPKGNDQAIPYLLLIGMFLLIFIVTLIIGGFVNYFLRMIFLFSDLGFIDNFFGALFGLVRAAIITIIIIYIVQLTPSASKPEWRESKVVMYFQPMTEWIVNKISPTLQNLKEKVNKTIEKIEPKNSGSTNTVPANTQPVNTQPANTGTTKF